MFGPAARKAYHHWDNGYDADVVLILRLIILILDSSPCGFSGILFPDKYVIRIAHKRREVRRTAKHVRHTDRPP